MQHPYAGVMGAGQGTTEAKPTRRSLLARMLGAVAALFGTGTAASAHTSGRGGTGVITTYALGEEGGVITTYALGEEGGVITTYALGEEGSYNPPRGRQTTSLALGEEGGRRQPPVRPPTTPGRRR